MNSSTWLTWEDYRIWSSGAPRLVREVDVWLHHSRSPEMHSVVLQGIFPTQGSNLGLLCCRQTLYHLGHQGSPFVKGAEVSDNLGAYSHYVSLNIRPEPEANPILPLDILVRWRNNNKTDITTGDSAISGIYKSFIWPVRTSWFLKLIHSFTHTTNIYHILKALKTYSLWRKGNPLTLLLRM